MKQHLKSRAEDSPARKDMLLALNYSGKHVYEGTVPTAIVAKRRAKNKAARAARRAARR
jgi:hypothetical protein